MATAEDVLNDIRKSPNINPGLLELIERYGALSEVEGAMAALDHVAKTPAHNISKDLAEIRDIGPSVTHGEVQGMLERLAKSILDERDRGLGAGG